MKIRLMQPNDFDQVRMVDHYAFLPSQADRKKRTRENIQSCFELNPTGCFVAEDSNGICGYIFSRIRGKCSWIGTFGVIPEAQKSGIGKRLLQTTTLQLEEKGCELIGLETNPASPYNIGLYLSNNYKLIEPTLTLTKNLEPQEANENFKITVPDHLERITSIDQSILPILNRYEEAKNIIDFTLGTILFENDHRDEGYFVVRTVSIAESSPLQILRVLFGGVTNNNTHVLEKLLLSVEKLAIQLNLSKIMISVNSCNSDVVKSLIQHQYKVLRLQARMILKGSYSNLKGFDIDPWGMV